MTEEKRTGFRLQQMEHKKGINFQIVMLNKF